MNRKAHIFVNDLFAGILLETLNGEFQFQYDEKYLAESLNLPVSLTLPLSPNVYISAFLFPFFDGLIPEGWLLDIATSNWKINPRDRMGLLLHLCEDTVGNVSVIEVHDE